MKRTALIVTALLLPGLSLAQTPTPGTPSAPVTPPAQPTSPSPASIDRERGTNANFQMLDSDADGRLSRSEAAADDKLGRGFAQADRNEDGYVDPREYRQHARPKADRSSDGERN